MLLMQDRQSTSNSSQGVKLQCWEITCGCGVSTSHGDNSNYVNFNQTHNEKPHSSNFQLLGFCHNCETNNH
jgi:hypothetical protein